MARDPAFNTTTRAARAGTSASGLVASVDALSAPVNDDLITASMTLWPQGPAWGTPDGQASSLSSMLARFTRVLISDFVWLYGRAFQLTREATVGGVNELLAEWEADHGLPEACFSGSEHSTSQRMTALARKVEAAPVNHPQDFVQLALEYGFEIEIEEPAIFECGFSEIGGFHSVGPYNEEVFWIVKVRGASVSFFEIGLGECSVDPLFSLGAAEQILCLVRQLAPAWTIPVLGPWIEYRLLGDGRGNIIGDGYGNVISIPANL